MDNEMGRLIIVPQYPTKLRYQEWWHTEFVHQFGNYFDEVICLDEGLSFIQKYEKRDSIQFAPLKHAIDFECMQIEQYMDLELYGDDILLLCDLSFPGFFTQALYHKRPKKCFAICHATSLNSYDIFYRDRKTKSKVEKATAELFNKVFVATEYHAKKLNWKNVMVQALPMPPMKGKNNSFPSIPIISVARNTIQKRSMNIELEVKRAFNCQIYNKTNYSSWDEYYETLANSKVLLITSKEETYGYQIVDAILNGCIPVAPNHFSYPELIPKDYLYNNIGELITILIKALGDQLPVPRLLTERNAWNFYRVLSETMKR
jgi:hypothetical protein